MNTTPHTRKMASLMHLMDGQKYYEPLRAALQQENLPEVNRLLCELETVCRKIHVETTNGTSDGNFTTNQNELKFWLIDVARLMLEEKSACTRRLALKALEAAVPLLVKSNYQELPVWAEVRTTISRDYTSLLDTARSEKDPHWHQMWAALVRVMNRDLCQGSSIINMFLSIVEAGFRCPELSIREQSFDCWRLLVEVFSNNKQMNLPKRMKLICIPLKSSKSKTETIALKKFDIWWYLLNELSPHLDGLADTIFEPFIYFCFGPSFKPPLCYYFDDSFQEYGAPGKIYQAIKQLSAIALIHLLGPAPEVTKTLLLSGEPGARMLTFDFPKDGMSISPVLFSTKAKLLIDASIECTVLFAQMKHLNYLELNRCLWGNLMERISGEKTTPKNELLQRIKEVMNALLRLCIKQENDVALRELLYDTLLIIAKSALLTVNIGYDSPEQPMLNYKSFMSAILHPDLPCPGDKSEEIIKHVFDLQRYSKQKGYWEMLQKTIQYLCETDGDNGISEFRTIRTQIYRHLGSYLIVQIHADPAGFAEHQSTVMGFLLYPLEYDQLVFIESVSSLWDEVYEPIALQEGKSCEFTNTFCEMIKAMTIAKFAFNLGVVADFFCTILRSLSPEFDSNKPPMKVFELFKDLTRKAQAYQANLNRVENMVSCFRELLEKMSITNMLTLILPIRNAINEMASNEQGLAMEEVKRTLNVVASKMVLSCMASELVRQPKEVQWNCKMLLSMMLELPADVKKGWKQADMRSCMDICDGKETKTPTRKKVKEEFVVIESNWKFKPEVLTDHQREKMMEKRTDIPALYNDMSQSQDSFVIKPWTPNKKHEPVRQERLTMDIVTSSVDTVPMTPATECLPLNTAEIVVPESVIVESTSEEDDPKAKSKRPDKENNYGNVLPEQVPFVKVKEEVVGSENEGTERTSASQQKPAKKSKRSILEQLRIDTVEGKTLDVMSLTRTRRSEAPEPRSTRRKNVPVRKVESEKKPRAGTATKLETKSVSVAKERTGKRDFHRSSRKLLNFENIDDPDNHSDIKTNTSDEVIESSQTPVPSQSLASRKVSLRGSRVEESSVNASVPPVVSIERNKKIDGDNTVAPPPFVNKEPTKSVEAQEVKQTNISEEDDSRSHMQVDGNLSEDDKAEDKARGDQIIPKSTVIENQKVDAKPAGDDKTECSRKKEARVESTCGRSDSSDQVKEPPVIPLCPSRRCTRLSSTDGNAVKVNDQAANRSLGECKGPQEATPLINPPPNFDVKQEKGTPTKPKLSGTDFPVRAALQLLNSPKRNLVEGMEQSLVENRTGLGSPKVARYSPLVVLEPMKDYIAVVKGDTGAISGEKAAEQKDVATSAIPSVDSTEQVNSGQACTTDQLSPVKNLDEEMEPLNKSLNRSIVSSPDLVNAEERNADLLNSTLNISPIAEEKGECAKAPDGSVLAGSADRRPSSRSMVRERDPSAAITPVQMPTMSRRTKPSPSQVLAASSSGGLKALRNQQNQPSSASSVSVMGTPRSPSTNMINLGGRGAQLINLIRQSPNPSTPPQNASTPKEGQSAASANRLMMRKKAITTSAASATLEANAAPSAIKQGEENQGTTQYLVFSKVLPSPQASPASSILKRRHNVDDSCDDIELPVNKRKRVSFHDPPVSVTKEYIRQVEECRSPSISRCLQLATSMSSADKAKYMMRRRSKSDSISELQNFTKDQQSEEPEVKTNTDAQGAGSGAADVDGDDEELTSSPESLDESQFMIHDATDNMPTLQVTAELMHVEQSSSEHESALVNGNAAGNSKSASPQETSEHEVSGGLRFASEEAVLEHVLQRYALDDIVERYLAAGQTLEHGKTVRMLTKELSSVMSKDPKTRHLVLDELSERHSVEFLEHAIQENSSAMVCERLSLTAMIDHIFKHLRSDCDGGAVASGSPSTMLDEKDNDSLRLVQRIYEMLSNLPNIESNGQTLTMLRDRFLREELGRRTRLEMMDLLEAYFKSIDRT
uniref:Telomere-associated protein Rif1 N-terminal domain-containing protein n=1 Tax=Anopheles atroparvus TaxID=41427 RepID=A0AAG5D1K8_ANOAO